MLSNNWLILEEVRALADIVPRLLAKAAHLNPLCITTTLPTRGQPLGGLGPTHLFQRGSLAIRARCNVHVWNGGKSTLIRLPPCGCEHVCRAMRTQLPHSLITENRLSMAARSTKLLVRTCEWETLVSLLYSRTPYRCGTPHARKHEAWCRTPPRHPKHWP